MQAARSYVFVFLGRATSKLAAVGGSVPTGGLRPAPGSAGGTLCKSVIVNPACLLGESNGEQETPQRAACEVWRAEGCSSGTG